MAVIRATLLVVLLGGTAAVCLVAGTRAGDLYAAMLAGRASAALAAVGLDWAGVEVDGLRIVLTGRAPDMLARALAAETLHLAGPPFAVVLDASTVVTLPVAVPPGPRVEIHRNGMRVTLTGQVPDAATQAGLARAFAEVAPRLVLEDLTETGARAGETVQPLPLALAALAVGEIPRARAVLESDHLSVTGLAASEEARLALTRRLHAAAPAGLALELQLDVPPPVAAPYAFSVWKPDPDGLRLAVCAARDDAEAAAIGAALRRDGLRDAPGPCPVALGGPPGDWPGAIAAGLAALAELPSGRFVLHYRSGTLTAPAEAPESGIEAARARLAAAVPAGYEIRIRRAEAPLEPAGAGSAPEPTAFGREYWMSFTSGSDGVVLAGHMPDRTGVEALATLAAVRFAGRIVHPALTLRDAAPPAGWHEAAFAALEALALLPEGRVQVAAGKLLLEGRIADPAAAGPIHRTLAEALPGLAVHTALTVDLPAEVATVRPTPARCAHLLNALVADRPIDFAPGSAVLAEAGAAILDAAAAILARCPTAAIEIGGHTDSQGSEDFNRRLSAARAEAVREALLARAVAGGRLVAVGYGEAEPIASNATESGRSQNRRIAFRPAR